MCDCCGEWCLEIKCPFKYTMDSIKQALDAQDKDFCLESAANGLHLKRAHPYYLQVQTLSPAPTTVTSLHGLKETWLWYTSSLM